MVNALIYTTLIDFGSIGVQVNPYGGLIMPQCFTGFQAFVGENHKILHFLHHFSPLKFNELIPENFSKG